MLFAASLPGCASEKRLYSKTPATPSGYVEFYAYKGRTLGYPIAIYEKRAGQYILLGKCGNLRALDSRKRFELVPGQHEFLLVHAKSQYPLRLRVEEGMITPVRMTITKLGSQPVDERTWQVRYRFEMNQESLIPRK